MLESCVDGDCNFFKDLAASSLLLGIWYQPWVWFTPTSIGSTLVSEVGFIGFVRSDVLQPNQS